VSDLVKLCLAAELTEGEPRQLLLEGFPPLAVYCIDGAYYVTDDTCTHGMASLSEGYQEGEEIECPFHGGAFNIKSGEPTEFPCSEPIKTYPVIEHDGGICIQSITDGKVAEG
jgi:ethylbenzene dioxygenase ferredoxin subunit